MTGAWEIGRPLGIRLGVHWSFWLLPALVVFSSSGVALGFNLAVLFAIFASVALHELGHAWAARQYGIRTRDIVLYPIGGVASLERMPSRPIQEIAIALAGPAVNLLIAGAIGGLFVLNGLAPGDTPTIIELFWERVLEANLVLLGFNLLPAFPMDGGRVLRAGLAMVLPRVRATEIATTLGTVFAGLFVIAAIWFGMPTLAVLAVFLFLAGRAEADMVRREELRRQWREEMTKTWTWPTAVSIPVVPVARPADGWVWNPVNRTWTKWQNGVPVIMERS